MAWAMSFWYVYSFIVSSEYFLKRLTSLLEQDHTGQTPHTAFPEADIIPWGWNAVASDVLAVGGMWTPSAPEHLRMISCGLGISRMNAHCLATHKWTLKERM